MQIDMYMYMYIDIYVFAVIQCIARICNIRPRKQPQLATVATNSWPRSADDDHVRILRAALCAGWAFPRSETHHRILKRTESHRAVPKHGCLRLPD